MSTEATGCTRPTTENSTAPNLAAPVFGVDADGCLHRFDNGDIIVTRDGDLEHHETDVGRDSVDHWISYVGQKRTWIDVWWNAQGADTAARLTATLAAAGEQEAE